MHMLGVIAFAIGVFSILGGFLNWDWFMNSRKAKFLVTILTRTGARIFYIILGLALITLGILDATGVVKLNPKEANKNMEVLMQQKLSKLQTDNQTITTNEEK